MNQEYQLTAAGKTKFWREHSLPAKPSWTPKEPILKQEKPAPKPRPPHPNKKTERNQEMCALRASGMSLEDLARHYRLHPRRVRVVLDLNLTPEEGEVDDRLSAAHQDMQTTTPEEAERAAALRRSGMRLKCVAKIIGRTVTTTIKLLRKVMPAEEIAKLARAGREHMRGKYKPDASPSAVHRRVDRPRLPRGIRAADTRPARDVVSFTMMGARRVYLLSCGHSVGTYASRPILKWKHCAECLK